MSMNDKQNNIKEFEKKKAEISEYLVRQINISKDILGRAYNVFVNVEVEVSIIPIGKKTKIGFRRRKKK